MHRRVRNSPWHDLPSELLQDISTRLGTRTDIHSFRAVCKHWHASTPTSLLHGKNILHPLLPHDIRRNSSFISDNLPGTSLKLVAFSVCHLRPVSDPTAGPWLATFEEVNPGKLYLRHPLSRTLVHNLPSEFPRALELSRFHVRELYRGHYLRFKDNVGDMFSKKRWAHYVISKVVLFVNPNVLNPSLADYRVVVLYKKGELLSLSLSVNEHDGGQEESWWCLQARGPVCRFDDVVNFEGKVYAVDRQGRAYVLEFGRPIARISTDALTHGSTKKWLVESSGELYLVYRISNPADSVVFKVCKMNMERNGWEVVKNLGIDRILFVTFDGCFFVPMKDLPGLKGNCIVFYKGCFSLYYDRFDNPDSRFINWSSNDLDVAVYYFDDVNDYLRSGLHHISYFRPYCELLWPPPGWLSVDACSSRRCSKDELGTTTSEEGKQETIESQLDTPSIAKCPECATLKFHGFDIRSDLVPTLESIWSFLGDITQGVLVRNGSIIAKGLESLAEAVIILQDYWLKKQLLNDTQVNIVRSTMSDLQFMCFKIDWLVQFVDRTLAKQHSRQQRLDLTA